MDRKDIIHHHLKSCAIEILGHIRELQDEAKDRWVSAAELRNSLDLNFVAVPKSGTQYGEKGWMFSMLARMLEDMDLIEHKKQGSRAFYRSKSR